VSGEGPAQLPSHPIQFQFPKMRCGAAAAFPYGYGLPLLVVRMIPFVQCRCTLPCRCRVVGLSRLGSHPVIPPPPGDPLARGSRAWRARGRSLLVACRAVACPRPRDPLPSPMIAVIMHIGDSLPYICVCAGLNAFCVRASATLGGHFSLQVAVVEYTLVQRHDIQAGLYPFLLAFSSINYAGGQ
jgi:hypothetical protein